MFVNRNQVQTTPEHKWMFTDEQTNDCSYEMISAADAKYRIFFGAASFGGLVSGDPEQLVMMLDARKSEFPAPKAPRGSTKALPFTFVGSDQFPARPWLRVRSAGGSDEANAEISRALRAGEIAEKIFFDRFRVLRGVLRVHTPTYVTRINACLRALHNYFITENPAYSAEYADISGLMAELKLTPPTLESVKKDEKEEVKKQPSPKQEKKNKNKKKDEQKLQPPTKHQEWMQKLGMDEGSFQKLLKRTVPHLTEIKCDLSAEMQLRMVLHWVATGNGYLAEFDLMFTATWLAMCKALADYIAEVITQVPTTLLDSLDQ